MLHALPIASSVTFTTVMIFDEDARRVIVSILLFLPLPQHLTILQIFVFVLIYFATGKHEAGLAAPQVCSLSRDTAVGSEMP
jgi:hypothetical protein